MYLNTGRYQLTDNLSCRRKNEPPLDFCHLSTFGRNLQVGITERGRCPFRHAATLFDAIPVNTTLRQRTTATTTTTTTTTATVTTTTSTWISQGSGAQHGSGCIGHVGWVGGVGVVDV